jgi:hypothetical protein
VRFSFPLQQVGSSASCLYKVAYDFSQKKYIKLVVTVFAVTLFFGCESNFKEIQKINFSEFVPGSDADMVNLKYTDSGRITAILVSSKMLLYYC